MMDSTEVERRHARVRALLCLSTIFCSGAALPAFAQSSPPQYVDVDANGVDLVSGNFVTTVKEGSIGTGEGAVSLVRTRLGSQDWIDNWSGGLMLQTSGGATTAYVILGSTSDAFSYSGSSFTSLTGDGATLVALSGPPIGYLYTASDGTQIQFNTNGATGVSRGFPLQGFACSQYGNTSCSIPVSITRPDGMKYTISWAYYFKCTSGSGPSCAAGVSYYRLTGVSSSAGYGFTIHYVTDTPGTGSAPQTNWYLKTSVTFSNANNPPASAPTVTYPTPSAGYPDFSDPAGRTWHFTGGDQTLLTALQRPAASTASTTISYLGTPSYVSSITRDGITTGYSRVVSGSTATTTITDAQSHQTIVVADLTKQRVTSVTQVMTPAPNIITTYVYDTSGRMTEVDYPEGNKTLYAYDARGNVTTVTQKAKPTPGGTDIVTTANYDTTCSNIVKCNQPNWTKDALTNETDYGYDPTTGLVTSVTAPAPTLGATRPQVRYAYTASAGVSLLTGISTCRTTASCAGGADETKASISYNSNLLPATISRGAGDGSLTSSSGLTYDSSGNLASLDGPLAGTADTITYRYDADNEPVGVIYPDPDGAGSLQRAATRLTYNADGQTTETEIGTVNSTSDADWAAFSSAQQLTTTYDSNGYKKTDVSTSGGTTSGVTQYSYDAVGRPECTAVRMNSAAWGSLPASACTLSTAGSYGDDRIVKTSYDAAGRAVKTTSGYGTAGASDDATVTYNPNGTQASLTDANANTTSYAYDGFDRLAKTSYPVTTKGAGTSSTTDYEELVYDAASNVTSRHLRGYASDSTKRIDYSYDALNRVALKHVADGSVTDVYYGYDLVGHQLYARFSSTSGSGITNSYDALGELTSTSNNMSGTARTLGYSYDLAGNRTRVTHPDSNYFDYYRDPDGRLYYADLNGATQLFYPLNDSLNRPSTLSRWVGGAWSNPTSYGYDGISRLTSLSHAVSGSGHNVTYGYGYSPANQIASRSRDNDGYAFGGYTDVSRGYTANGLNQYTAAGTASFSYDTRGDLSGDGSNSYIYDAENRMTSVSGAHSATLTYDPYGRLFSVVSGVNTTQFLYDGDDLVQEYDGSGALLRRYVHGDGTDQPLIWYEGSGVTSPRYLYADERGSVTAVTDGSGSLLSTNTYDEYGIPASGNAGRFQYTSQSWLAELGLYYYKARMYSPTLGRFMQTDPIGYQDGPNWYNYAGADPMNFSDPSGTDCMVSSHVEVYKGFLDGHFEDVGSEPGSARTVTYPGCGTPSTGGSSSLAGGTGGGNGKGAPGNKPQKNFQSCHNAKLTLKNGYLTVASAGIGAMTFQGTLEDPVSGATYDFMAKGALGDPGVGGGVAAGIYSISGTINSFSDLSRPFIIEFAAVGYGPLSLGAAHITQANHNGRPDYPIGDVSVGGVLAPPAGAAFATFNNAAVKQTYTGQGC